MGSSTDIHVLCCSCFDRLTRALSSAVHEGLPAVHKLSVQPSSSSRDPFPSVADVMKASENVHITTMTLCQTLDTFNTLLTTTALTTPTLSSPLSNRALSMTLPKASLMMTSPPYLRLPSRE